MSRRIGLGGVALNVGLCLLCGCSSGSPEGRTIRQAGELTLYEGLPHQFYEADSLEAEKKAKPTIELHGFPFYRETLKLIDGDEEKLKALLSDNRSYQAYSGEKRCGGFHPDYAVSWSVESKPYVCLICFGCGEFRMDGPAGETQYDIPHQTQVQLKKLLASYQQNRPQFRVGTE